MHDCFIFWLGCGFCHGYFCSDFYGEQSYVFIYFFPLMENVQQASPLNLPLEWQEKGSRPNRNRRGAYYRDFTVLISDCIFI